MPAHEFIVDSSGPTVQIPPVRTSADDEAVDPEARVLAWMERARAAEEAFVNLLREQAQRSDHQVLVSVAQLLEENLATQRHTLSELREINAKLGTSSGSDSRSHVEVKTSARGVDVTSKCYEGSSMEGLSDGAIEEYFGTLDKVQARLNGSTAGK